MNLEYSLLGSQLHLRFPQLNDQRYASLTGNIDVDDEPFVLFGVVFNHYLMEVGCSGFYDSKVEVGAFLEEMASSSDSRVTLLLTSELLPTLVGSQSMINAYWPVLGISTRRMLRLLSPKLTAGVELPSTE